MSLCLLLLLHYAWQTLRGRCVLGFWYVITCPAIAWIRVALSCTCAMLLICLFLSYTMRGRPFVVVGLWVTSLLPLTMLLLDLSITCLLLTPVYHLTCHYLARPYCYDMIDPALDTFSVMFYCLLYITTLSCYHLNQAWCTWLVIVIFTGTLTCYTVSWSVTCIPALYAVTCIPALYAVTCIPAYYAVTWLYILMYSWFLIMTYSCHSRKLIIRNKLQLVLGYGRKWWMPEWYLAYSLGICYLITSTYLYKCRWYLAYSLGICYMITATYLYKKRYQFSIHFR